MSFINYRTEVKERLVIHTVIWVKIRIINKRPIVNNKELFGLLQLFTIMIKTF